MTAGQSRRRKRKAVDDAVRAGQTTRAQRQARKTANDELRRVALRMQIIADLFAGAGVSAARPVAQRSSSVRKPDRARRFHGVGRVITGAGIVTALGMGWKPNAEGFRAGRRAFRPVSQFDVSRQRVKIAAEVDLPKKFSADAAQRASACPA
jgi:hypothetical protein